MPHNSLLLCLCLLCICAYAPVFVRGLQVHMCACMGRPNIHVKCLPWLFFISCFLTGSLIDPRTHWLDWLASEFWDPLASTLLSVLVLQTVMSVIGFSYMCQDPNKALFSRLCSRHFSELSLPPSLSFYCRQDARLRPASRSLWMSWNNLTTPCFCNISPQGWTEFPEAKMRIFYLELFCDKPVCLRAVSWKNYNLLHFLKISLSESV